MSLHYFNPAWIEPTDRVLEADVCVYGGTAGGVIAAVTAADRGRSVVLLHPGRHLGGMTSGGLGFTDLGNKAAIGGRSREFYRRCGKHYGEEETWTFEPGVAERILEQWIESAGASVHRGAFLNTVAMEGKRIAAVRMLGGLTVKAKAFIDATYEGDLMARAGVSYAVGRESNAVFGETLNGAQCEDKHQFSSPVDPYVVPGDITSGPLAMVNPQAMPPEGTGDHRIQAYCFRMCMTDREDLRVDWPRPAGYDPADYELAARWFQAEKDDYNEMLRGEGHELRKFDRLKPVPHKTDTNNHGPFSSDYIGANYAWPDTDYVTRERIFQEHVRYQQGFYWFMANDERVPERYREAYAQWGLAADEFTDTGHWPHQLYVREARRMMGDYVMTENDCMGRRRCEDPVGMGAYNMDSHNCQRFVHLEADGTARVYNEGDVQVGLPGPYPISYRSIVPKRGECENLAVPVAVSASHIAFGSVRMEPVFMILGESAATAVDLALDAGSSLQALPYEELAGELEKADQVLNAEVANTESGNPA